MTKTTLKIASLYTLFALAAMGINLGSQRLALYFYQGSLDVYIAMAVGTLTGLVTKYLLDKNYIFRYKTKSKAEDMGKFILYSVMGVITTAMFWGSELTFHYIIPEDWAKYVGGAVGLTAGYITKYHLDKRFVFV